MSRLPEPVEYYERMLEFLEEWKVDLLIAHFSDDHGLAISLPGFEGEARDHALTLSQCERLLKMAEARGIEVVPEVECLGHTRYLTDREKYRHLATASAGPELNHNSIDPEHPDTWKLIDALFHSVGGLFSSRYIHVGCDEANLKPWAEKRGKDPRKVWLKFVNRLVARVIEMNRVPVIWSDHFEIHPESLAEMDSRVVVDWWKYEADPDPEPLKRFKAKGFAEVWVSPALAWHGSRVLPNLSSIKNMARLGAFAGQYQADAYVNTMWDPFRYVQHANWFGIAYGAMCGQEQKEVPLTRFAETFQSRVFQTPDSPEKDGLLSFLENYPKVEVTCGMSEVLCGSLDSLPKGEEALAKKSLESARLCLRTSRGIKVSRNSDIFEGMVLAVEIAEVLLKAVLFKANGEHPGNDFERTRAKVMDKYREDWNRCRFDDQVERESPPFTNESASMLGVLLKCAKLTSV